MLLIDLVQPKNGPTHTDVPGFLQQTAVINDPFSINLSHHPSREKKQKTVKPGYIFSPAGRHITDHGWQKENKRSGQALKRNWTMHLNDTLKHVFFRHFSLI